MESQHFKTLRARAEKLHTVEDLRASGLFCFRWWYKGRTLEGNTIKLEGRVVAHDASEACDRVEKQMRAEYPTMRWMQGKELEGDGVTCGPTVQKLKTPVEAAKQNK